MAEIKIPELAESITEGTVARWLKNIGDRIEKGDYLVELETDKVNVEINSDYSGILTEMKYNEGDTVQVGEIIAVVSEGQELGQPAQVKREEPAPAIEKKNAVQVVEAMEARPIASPSARKLAREKGIDLSQVPTTDPLGRVRAHDVQSYNPAQQVHGQAPFLPQVPEVGSHVPSMDEGSTHKRVERIRMSRRRQTIANRLVEVQHTAAMLTTFNEVDMTHVLNLRKRRKDRFFEENDVKLGFMSFFTKAVVAALKKSPLLNAEIQGDEILLKKYYDIGIAVSAPEGLVVPVVRDADRKNFAEIEKDILDLADKARQNKLALKDLQGGTFTITNGGIFGSLMSTPILNGPQVGILGMHAVKLRPIAIDEETMENRPMMYIALSYDHRIVDGKEAVTFLKKVKELIEDPESLIFE